MVYQLANDVIGISDIDDIIRPKFKCRFESIRIGHFRLYPAWTVQDIKLILSGNLRRQILN